MDAYSSRAAPRRFLPWVRISWRVSSGTMLRLLGGESKGVEPFLVAEFPLVQFEDVGCDEVAEYPEQDDDYDDEIQVRL